MKKLFTVVMLVALAALADTPITTLQNFEMECTTTAQPIQPDTAVVNFSSLSCDNYASATPVYVGGANVTAASPHICIASAGCGGRQSWSPEVAKGAPYCRVASGTVTIGCMGGY